VERFAPKANAGTGPDEAFEVELALTGQTVTIPADVSVLDAMEDAGVSIMSSCEEGVCGTCEARVLSGAIDHRDSVLTERERAAGDKMMVCVSRARSPRLVLDL
jgi:ferredoxin